MLCVGWRGGSVTLSSPEPGDAPHSARVPRGLQEGTRWLDTGLGLLVLTSPPLRLSGLLEPPASPRGRTGKRGGNFSLPRLGWDPPCAPWLGPVGVATPRWPVGPHIHSPRELGLTGLSLARGLRSHGQVDQNPEQLPAQTCCSGIKVPLCQNN